MLILDEPINGLDPQGIIEFRETILRLNQELHMTILISSHILGELSKISTYYGIIKNKSMVRQMSLKELEEICRNYLFIKVERAQEAAQRIEQAFRAHQCEVTEGGEIRLFGINEQRPSTSCSISFRLSVRQVVSRVIMRGSTSNLHYKMPYPGVHKY